MELKERPIVSAVTAYDHPYDGNTYILQVNEGIWLGEDQKHSLLCPNQIRDHGYECDSIPRFKSKGKSIHGIKISEDLTLHYELKGNSLSCAQGSQQGLN